MVYIGLPSDISNALIICWGHAPRGVITTLPITFNTVYRVVTSIESSSSESAATWTQLCVHKDSLSTIQANNGNGEPNEYVCIGF